MGYGYSDVAYTYLNPNGNADSLDILAFGFTVDPATGRLVGLIRVQSLSSGVDAQPQIAGNADMWVIYFNAHGVTYYLMATHGLGASISGQPQVYETFEFGTVQLAAGETPSYSVLGNAEGNIDHETNLITIYASYPAFDMRSSGLDLANGEAVSYGRIGPTVGAGYPIAVNDVRAGQGYIVGTEC